MSVEVISHFYAARHVSRKAVSFIDELSFFFINTLLSAAAQWMSNVFPRFVRRQSFINWSRDLAHPSSNFHRGSKSAKFCVIFNITRLWAFENAARCHNSETKIFSSDDRPISPPSLVKLGPGTPENLLSVVPHTLLLHGKNVLNRLFRPGSNFVQSLNTWHPKCCKSSRSRDQRSRSQRDTTCAEIRKIINNSAGYCSISLKFLTHFDYVTLDVPQTFKVNWSEVKVTAWHYV